MILNLFPSTGSRFFECTSRCGTIGEREGRYRDLIGVKLPPLLEDRIGAITMTLPIDTGPGSCSSTRIRANLTAGSIAFSSLGLLESRVTAKAVRGRRSALTADTVLWWPIIGRRHGHRAAVIEIAP